MAAVDLFVLQPKTGLLVVGAIAMPWTSAFGPYSGLTSCDLLLDLYRMVLYVYCLKLVLKFSGINFFYATSFPINLFTEPVNYPTRWNERERSLEKF